MPADVGEKVIEAVQDPPGAIGEPQVLFCAKDVASGPANVYELMFSTALPVLEIVTVCAVDFVPAICVLKVRLVGDAVAIGAGGGGVMPEIETCGLVTALRM